jgi:hypothetical protein
MATITVSSVLARCAVLLQDPTNIRWPQAELLDWLNDGQREIALYKPNAFVKNQSKQLSAGTKQALPADGVSLIDVVRNMGTNGTTPGNAIRAVAREILDSQTPGWHASTAAAAAKHFVYSVLDPKNFYVYPPNDGTGHVEIIYVAAPADATLLSVITLDDIFVTALVNYVMYRAYSKDAEFAANATAAQAYYQAFQGNLAGKAGAEAGSNPNAALMPFNPNLPGGNK